MCSNKLTGVYFPLAIFSTRKQKCKQKTVFENCCISHPTQSSSECTLINKTSMEKTTLSKRHSMSVERGQLEIKNLSAINCKANEDPASLNVGSRRRLNQPNLKGKTIVSAKTTSRLTQRVILIYNNISGYQTSHL